MKVVCDLYAEWVKAIRVEFSKAKFPHESLDDQECVVRWMSWQRRCIPIKQRRVVRADTFACPPEHADGLRDFAAAVASGDKLWPWQSKGVDKVSYEDGLLNDYGVHHFHLGKGFQPSGYINRTGPLLFAVVRDDAVYEIGIYHHGEWYERDILDIIDRNWPELLDPVTIPALQTRFAPKTREEVKALREANVLPVFALRSGRVVMPLGGGVATDGTSNEAVDNAMYWAKFLAEADKHVIAQVENLVRQGKLPDEDYPVALHATADEIVAVVGDRLGIVVWRRRQQPAGV